MKYKTLLTISLIALGSIGSTAQNLFADRDTSHNNFLQKSAQHGIHYHITAGYNIGGTMPVPLPAEIRALDSYKPGTNFSLEVSVGKTFGNSRWGIQSGLRLDTRGMETQASVKNYHMEMIGDEGEHLVGVWTGPVKTNARNWYLTLPVLATYNIGRRWQVNLGPYISWMFDGKFGGEVFSDEQHPGIFRDGDPTGERTEVTHATYDFDEELRNLSCGIQAGVDCIVGRRILLGANLQWGLLSAFPSNFTAISFDMYPVYGNLHLGYAF